MWVFVTPLILLCLLALVVYILDNSGRTRTSTKNGKSNTKNAPDGVGESWKQPLLNTKFVTVWPDSLEVHAPICTHNIQEMMDGDRDMIAELIMTFIESSNLEYRAVRPSSLLLLKLPTAQIKEGLDKENPADVMLHSHSLKGASSYLGAERVVFPILY